MATATPTSTSSAERAPTTSRLSAPPANAANAPLDADAMLALLRGRGLVLADRRPNGGALWVVGGLEHAPLMRALHAKGFRFTFVRQGTASTQQQPAWYLERDAR